MDGSFRRSLTFRVCACVFVCVLQTQECKYVDLPLPQMVGQPLACPSVLCLHGNVPVWISFFTSALKTSVFGDGLFGNA